MVQRVAGLMVESRWGHPENKFPNIMLDAFIVMPNHLHRIVFLGGRFLNEAGPVSATSGHIEPQLQDMEGSIIGVAEPVAADLRVRSSSSDALMLSSPTLGTVIQWFKTMTTNDYLRGVQRHDFPPFDRRLWQPNYYEHIIRNDASLERIREYISGNPGRWTEDEENPNRIGERAKPAGWNRPSL